MNPVDGSIEEAADFRAGAPRPDAARRATNEHSAKTALSCAEPTISSAWLDRGSICIHQDAGLIPCFATVSRTAILQVADESDVFILVARGVAQTESRDGRFFLPKNRWISLVQGAAPTIVTQAGSLVLALLLPPTSKHPSLPAIFPAHGTITGQERRVAFSLWRSAQQAAQSGIDGQLILGRAFYLLTSLQNEQRGLTRHCPGHTSERRHQIFVRMQRILLLLEGNLERDLRLGELASLCSMSPWHFTKTFKAVYGLGPREMVSAIKLRKAADLLNFTSHSIGEIAYQSGFESSSTFARAFRGRFGISASAFRNLKRNANPCTTLAL